MAVSFLKRYSLKKAFNEALQNGRVEAAAKIDAEFRDLISRESSVNRSSYSKTFREDSKKTFRANYIACLKIQYRVAYEQGLTERANEIKKDFMSLYPDMQDLTGVSAEQQREIKAFEEVITTSDVFRRKLDVLHGKFLQLRTDVSQGITFLYYAIRTLNEMQLAVAEKIAELRLDYARPQLGSVTLIKDEIHALEALDKEIKEKILSYTKRREALLTTRNAGQLSESQSMLITRYIDEYFSCRERDDVEKAQEAIAELDKVVKDNIVAEKFAAQYLNTLVKIEHRRSGSFSDLPAYVVKESKKEGEKEEDKYEEISLLDDESPASAEQQATVELQEVDSKSKKKLSNPLKSLYRIFHPKTVFDSDADKYLTYMSESFGRFFHQTRFLVSAFKFLAIPNIESNLSDFNREQRQKLGSIFSRQEYTNLIAASKSSPEGSPFKKLGVDLDKIHGKFLTLRALPNQVGPEIKKSRTPLKYKNAFSQRRFSNYVARKAVKESSVSFRR
jgi:hypothetical protein